MLLLSRGNSVIHEQTTTVVGESLGMRLPLPKYYPTSENWKVAGSAIAWRPFSLARILHVDRADAARTAGARPAVVPQACHKPGSITVNQGHS
jgi:hypothetical protein